MMFTSSQKKALAVIAGLSLMIGTLILVTDPPASTDGHDHASDEHDHDHGDEGGLPGHVEISLETAKAAGVEVAAARPHKIATLVTVMGSIVLDPTGHARVNARFTGLIREVRKNIGDKVSAGEALASVESNESLQAYQVKSPIDGVVIWRNKNVGEITGPEPLFEVANLSRVWSELHVFPRDLPKVKTGQRALLSTADGLVRGEGQISAVLPVAEASSQSVLARVALENPEGAWRPGTAVRGDIVVAETEAAVAVPVGAVQTINGQPVVFVVSGQVFEVRPVLLGATDGSWVEILEGLYEDEVYARTNSYLFKADIGKASAEHEH